MIASAPGRRARGRRLRWVIVICLVLLIVFLVAFSLAQIHPVQAYLVAAHSLPAGTILTNDDLQSRDLDPGSVPPSAVLAQDSNTVVGQQVVIPFAAGDIIASSHLGSASGDIAAGIPKDMRVFKLPTTNIVLPDGLQPGDKIDMILTSHDASGTVVTEYLIQGLVIRAIAADNSSITFVVPPAVAELIVHAQQAGQIVILAAPTDEQFAVLPPVTSNQPCQIYLGPNGEPTTVPSLNATPCPSIPGGNLPSPTASPSAQPSPGASSTP
jgi:Flp pilus assembly protein CpaB